MSSAIRTTLTPRSIRAQLTLWYLLMTAGALAAFAVFIFVTRQRALEHEVDAELWLAAQRLVADLQPKLLETIDLGDALTEDRSLIERPLIVRDAQGPLLFRSPAFPLLGGAAEAAALDAARNGERLLTIDDRDGNQYRLATAIVMRTGASPIAIQTVAPTAPVRTALGQLVLAMLLWSAVVLSAASYGGRFIARRALQPVDAIVDRVRAIEATELRERLEVRAGSEELDRLVETLNGMLDRLATSMSGARRFAADASHELQTPIAAMRAALDSCLSDEHADADDVRAVADDLVVDLDRLSALVRDLRLLALADAGHLLDRVETIDLSALVLECCEFVRAAVEPKAVTIAVDSVAEVRVCGNALHLRRALFNLAHNAVRYSPDGSTVHVTVQPFESDAIIEIADEGCGIAPQDLPHIFERFYRADKARARETGGTGLGLAIADQIVRSHGGRIDVSSAIDSGSIFTVLLPLAHAGVSTVNAA
jgi:signal transduction histidine kinase